MAAPNLMSLTTITAKSKQQQATGTLADMLENTAASGKVFKVNTILAANIGSATVAVTVDVAIVRSATTRYLTKDVTIPGAGSLFVLEGSPIYLEEGDKIQIKAGAVSFVDVTISYEECS